MPTTDQLAYSFNFSSEFSFVNTSMSKNAASNENSIVSLINLSKCEANGRTITFVIVQIN